MDFNSIFKGRGQPQQSLEGGRTDDVVYAYWADYLDEIAPQGRTEFAVKKAQDLHRRLLKRVREDEELIRNVPGVYRQTHKLDKHQSEELIAELERFVRSRETPPGMPPRKTLDVIENFLDDNVRVTYNIVIHMLFQGIYEAEEILNHISATPVSKRSRGQTLAFERASERVADLLRTFQKDTPALKARYEALKANTKRQIPPHLHRLIDKVVDLFVYDPYELGILYIRRNLSGTVGAFYGVDEGE